MSTSNDPQSDPDSFSFCQKELKRTDPLARFMALVASEEHRPALMVLDAFLADIARIPLQVTEPAMGEIRLQWWRDVVGAPDTGRDQGCGAANIGPLASALKDVMRQYQLSAATLQQLLDARVFDLYSDPMPDIAAYETYAGETRSLPLMLAAQILNNGILPEGIADLCGHAGMAISLSDHLYNWPRDAARQRLFLPLDAFTAHQVTVSDILTSKPSPRTEQAISDLCQLAREHHFKASAHLKSTKAQGNGHLLPALLMLAPAQLQLKKREKAPLKPLKLSNWRLYASVMRMAALG